MAWRPEHSGWTTRPRLPARWRTLAVVLHCAGPFSRTALPMYDACLKTGAHYLDITGEVDVFEALAARGAEAAAAGIMVLPGVGFDVVPSDCLIADLAARHPGGRTLRLGLAARSGASRGTMRTVAQAIGQFRIRRDGAIATVRPGQLRHAFDFGPPPDTALVGVLGDVTTAFHSTGIPNIETYLQATRSFTRLTRILRGFGPLLAARTGQALLNRLLDRGPEGPSEVGAPDGARNPGRGDRRRGGEAGGGARAHAGPLRLHRDRGRRDRGTRPRRRLQAGLPDPVFRVRRGPAAAVRRSDVGIA